MDKEMKMMVHTIVDEMGKIEKKIDGRFDILESRLDSMQHEINACKLERESIWHCLWESDRNGSINICKCKSA